MVDFSDERSVVGNESCFYFDVAFILYPVASSAY
jgi:hypothetical protein